MNIPAPYWCILDEYAWHFLKGGRLGIYVFAALHESKALTFLPISSQPPQQLILTQTHMLRHIVENAIERPDSQCRVTRNRDVMFTVLILMRQTHMASCLARRFVTHFSKATNQFVSALVAW